MTAWSNIFSYITGTFPDVTAKAASGTSAKDGTEWKTTAVDNFWFGPIQALFNLFSKTPDGVTESKDASQILELWRQLAAYKELQTATTSDALVFGDKSYSIELDCSSGNLSIPTLPLPDFRGQTIDFVVTGAGTGTIAAGSGITYDLILYSTKGASLVAVESSGALQWEVVIDEKRVCKAWVNFDGTGAVSIRDSYNVSSITDNGIGDYTVNFTNDMNDANYTVVVTVGGIIADRYATYDTQTTSSFNIKIKNASGSSFDGADISFHVFGS